MSKELTHTHTHTRCLADAEWDSAHDGHRSDVLRGKQGGQGGVKTRGGACEQGGMPDLTPCTHSSFLATLIPQFTYTLMLVDTRTCNRLRWYLHYTHAQSHIYTYANIYTTTPEPTPPRTTPYTSTPTRVGCRAVYHQWYLLLSLTGQPGPVSTDPAVAL